MGRRHTGRRPVFWNDWISNSCTRRRIVGPFDVGVTLDLERAFHWRDAGGVELVRSRRLVDDARPGDQPQPLREARHRHRRHGVLKRWRPLMDTGDAVGSANHRTDRHGIGLQRFHHGGAPAKILDIAFSFCGKTIFCMQSRVAIPALIKVGRSFAAVSTDEISSCVGDGRVGIR